MNVICQSGNWFLIDVGGGEGRVLDLDFGRFFPPMALISLLAKGGWEPFNGNQEDVLRALDGVEDLDRHAGSERGRASEARYGRLARTGTHRPVGA